VIKRLGERHEIKLLCRAFGVSRSRYYEAVHGKASPRSIENGEISKKIKEIYDGSKKRYGCIKIKHALEREGVHISQGRVLRLMRGMGIRSVVCSKYRSRKSGGDDPERVNVLRRRFKTEKPNQVWLADITYIRTRKDGWTYLAVVLDLCTRKVVGHSYGRNMTAELAVESLLNAWRGQGFPQNVLLHTDQGSQYTSDLCVQTAIRLNMRLSYSAKGTPIDNSPMESFNSILKKEEVYLDSYADFEAAKLKIFDFIEGFYNRNRIHGSIGFMSPADFEATFAEP